jgi:hypothetical protein
MPKLVVAMGTERPARVWLREPVAYRPAIEECSKSMPAIRVPPTNVHLTLPLAEHETAYFPCSSRTHPQPTRMALTASWTRQNPSG